jgi:hypothetical protein
MRIYESTHLQNSPSVNVHIPKMLSVDAHLWKWSAFVNVHIQKLSFVNPHIRKSSFINVRKTGPRSNKIKQMQKQNTEDTQYKRDTDLRGSPSVGYVHQRNCQVLPLLLSSKMKG